VKLYAVAAAAFLGDDTIQLPAHENHGTATTGDVNFMGTFRDQRINVVETLQLIDKFDWHAWLQTWPSVQGSSLLATPVCLFPVF
jgi:hypothetical protein